MSEKNLSLAFSVNPLDINIAKIQYNLLKRFEKDIPCLGDFPPVIEEYLSKDPTLTISLIQVNCKSVTENIRALELIVYNKTKENRSCFVLSEGTNDDILAYLKKSDFLIDSKKFIKNI